MRIDENDPRLTSYALGEMEESGRAAFEELLESDDDARRHLDEIRRTARLLTEELHAEALPGLSREQHAAMEAKLAAMAAGLAAPRNVVSFRIPLLARRTWHLLASNAAAFVLVASALALPLLWTILRDQGPPTNLAGRLGERGRHDRVLLPFVPITPRQAPPATPEKSPAARDARSHADRTVPAEDLESPGQGAGVVPAAPAENAAEDSGQSGERHRELRYQTGIIETETTFRTGENPFVPVVRNPLSTFPIDVGTGSYSSVRRLLKERRLPPRDAVRIEELINHFEYDYPEPTGDDPLAVAVGVAAAPWAPAHRLVRIGLHGRTQAGEASSTRRDGAPVTIAKDVRIQVEFNPCQVDSYRLIGYENRVAREPEWVDDAREGGEMGAGHSVTALYEVVPPGIGATPVNTQPIRDQPAGLLTDAAGSDELLTVTVRYRDPDRPELRLIGQHVRDEAESFEEADADLRFAAAVASFGMLLRDSPFKGSATLDSTLAWARESLGEAARGERAEFVDLVLTARTLMKS